MSEQWIRERYRLTKKLLRGDSARGLPELWLAEDAGDLYYAKLWKKRSSESFDLAGLWNREVRGLSRLQGYPGAAELFVRLQDLGSDPKYYYAILDGGPRQLLSEVFENRQQYSWLRNLGEVGRRRSLWEGLLRIAEALAILHGEGTIHRSLSASSIFVHPEGQGDFRLSGFEWSLRIVGSEGASAKVGHRNLIMAPEVADHQREYSTATDWFDFGLLAAELFGVPIRRFKKRESVRAAVAELSNLREGERSLILSLLEEDREQRLADSEAVTRAVRGLQQELSIASTSIGRSLLLAIRLGPDIALTRAIASAANGMAPINSPEAQRAWIEHDLRGDIRVTARNAPQPHFILRGAKLEYRVRPWMHKSLSTWDIGFCDSIEQFPRMGAEDQYFSLGDRKLEILTFSDVYRTFQKVRDRSAAWDKVFSFRRIRAQLEPNLSEILDFFRITQQLDTVLTAAQVCPTEIIASHRSPSETEVVLTPRDEGERNDLARHLGLQTPAEQLRDWFDLGAEEILVPEEDDPKRHTYQILERRTIANEPGNIADWHFVGARPHPSGVQYRFRTQGSVRVRENAVVYLARDYGGTISQLRRRHRAIEDLRSHETLLRLLSDPRGVSRRSSDEVPDERAPIPLDESKIGALEDLWRTQPSFAVQGPPGTGKTTLIQAFVDRLFAQDPSAQILITAHSHHTVDDVRQKLAALFSELPPRQRPILLRLSPVRPTDHDLPIVTASLIDLLAGSALAKAAPQFLRDRLAQACGAGDDKTDVRTMQLLVQDAANLTLATLNSKDLADMASRSRRFDWSVIEEAAKAHGFDMAVALQESHRLLLIGDHFQLPPFNAKLFKDLLGDPLRVRRAVQTGAQFAPTLVDGALVEDDPELLPFEDRCAHWRRLVTLFEVLFQRSMNAEPGEPRPAATLTNQHRMHPDIADIVGMTFYPDASGGTILKSPPDVVDRFKRPPPFGIKSGSWMPDSRVVWVDVPWVQKKEFAEGETIGLFSAPVEAAAIVEVLDSFVPIDGMSCEVQILSPYNDQLACIRANVEAARERGRLQSMFSSPFDLRVGKRLGATVDEFQGSEADIVVVSLVRNNALVPWKSIGFLKEANRMNVLLSRAKQKLIIVGSWDFFNTRCGQFTPSDEEYSYIGRMMNVMAAAESRGLLAKVSKT